MRGRRCVEALSMYEDELSDSRAQMSAVTLLVGTLARLRCLASEESRALRAQCLLACAKLFKKPDQCRAVLMCARLFWPPAQPGSSEASDEQKVASLTEPIFHVKTFKMLNLCVILYF